MRRRALTLALLTAIAALLTPGLAAAAAKHGKKVKPRTQYYVSIGDSYASGYQPGVTGPNRNGYAYQLPKIAAKRGYKLKLVNFGCGGATTESILKQKLAPGAKCLGPGAPKFSGTQAAAAEKFIKANRRDVVLVTVSISGNEGVKTSFIRNRVKAIRPGEPYSPKVLEQVRKDVADAVAEIETA